MINVTGYVFIVKKDNRAIRCFTDEGKATDYAISICGVVDVIAID